MDTKRNKDRKGLGDVGDALDALDMAEVGGKANKDARQAERYKYRPHEVVLEITDKSDPDTTVACQPRNISNTGVSLIVNKFLYPGTACRIRLISVINHKVHQSGRVVRCRYLTGTARLHEIGIKFDSPINAAMFHHGTTPPRILLIAEEHVAQTLQALLGRDFASVNCVDDPANALETMKRREADIVILDPNSGDGAEFAKALRGEGIIAPLIVLAEEGGDGDAEFIELGFDAVMKQPFSRDKVRSLIDEYRTEPLTSNLVFDAEIAEVIDAFVNRVPTICEAIQALLAKDEAGELEKALRNLQYAASTAGFDRIADEVVEVLGSLNPEKKATEMTRAIIHVLRLCDGAIGASCQV